MATRRYRRLELALPRQLGGREWRRRGDAALRDQNIEFMAITDTLTREKAAALKKARPRTPH